MGLIRAKIGKFWNFLILQAFEGNDLTTKDTEYTKVRIEKPNFVLFVYFVVEK